MQKVSQCEKSSTVKSLPLQQSLLITADSQSNQQIISILSAISLLIRAKSRRKPSVQVYNLSNFRRGQSIQFLAM